MVRSSDDPLVPPRELLELLAELEPAEVIVGIPFHMDGSAGEMAREAREFAHNLEERLDVPVIEWDERLTTAQAERFLREAGGKKGGRRERERGRVDQAAAAVLLRSYLAAR